MKHFVLLVLISFAAPVFALTGVIKSKVLGRQVVQLHVAAIPLVPTPVTVTVHVEHDTQDMNCSQDIHFANAMQMNFKFNGTEVQEFLNLIVPVSYNQINNESQCTTAETAKLGTVTPYLWKVPNPQFVISKAVENGVLVQTQLVLSSAGQIVTAELAAVSPGFYTLKKMQFPRSLTMNFSVVKSSPGSVSYLEHGTVTFQ